MPLSLLVISGLCSLVCYVPFVPLSSCLLWELVFSSVLTFFVAIAPSGRCVSSVFSVYMFPSLCSIPCLPCLSCAFKYVLQRKRDSIECVCLCVSLSENMRVGSSSNTPQENPAPKSTEDLRPDISAISTNPSQQEKEGGPRWGVQGQGVGVSEDQRLQVANPARGLQVPKNHLAELPDTEKDSSHPVSPKE